jgi:hypothetical protein
VLCGSLALLAALAIGAALARSAAAQPPAAAAPVVIDGPGPDIVRPSGLGLSIARDGTGGLAYLKRVAGVAHVFVSQLAGGSFQPPAQVDASLGGASSQPVIAAGNGGLLLLAFVNGGQMYVANRASSSSSFTAPIAIAGNSSSPSISISNFGKAYVAFTTTDGSGHDVRAAYYYNGNWALEAPPLNVTAADDAGTGAGAPDVATAGDGVAVVVWGEGGHIYSRRVWGTTPSAVVEQADGPPSGCTEGSASNPAVGTEGDSSYADVAFQEVANCGGPQQTRVLMNQLVGSAFNGVSEPDGLTGSTTDNAVNPAITMGEYGRGWVTSIHTTSRSVFATELWDYGQSVGTTQINGLAEITTPVAVPATAGLYSNLIAFQQNPGAAGLADIRTRYASQGLIGPEMVLSSPAQGAADAADGLAAAGDVAGDAAVAWIQGSPGALQVVTSQLYEAPGGFSPGTTFQFSRTAQPALAWSAARDSWGPITYSVGIDGAQVAQTQSTSVRVPAPIPDGPHSWQVTASNPAGQQTSDRAATVFVDTVPPTATFTVYGRRLVGSRLHLYTTYGDLPQPGEARADASGVAKVVVRWDDGTTVTLRRGFHRSFHGYRRPGRYTVTVMVTDKAGNVTRVLMVIKITKPKAKSTKPPSRIMPTKSSTKPKPKSGGATPAHAQVGGTGIGAGSKT